MILCGGLGTRLRDVTELLPKPMVPVGPQPIIWHIMKNYAAFGIKRFILCLGYKREVFIDYFLNYHARSCDITLTLGKQGNIKYHGSHGEEDWEVTLADTGELTMTGGRIVAAAKYLRPEDKNFFLTYGDAVADVNINDLFAQHIAKDKELTITAVRAPSRFGELKIGEDSSITGFSEKTNTDTGHINGGFMAAKRSFIENYVDIGRDCFLEQEPMQKLVSRDQITAYLHEGFWQCMDNAREHKRLNDMWEAGDTPWTANWD